LLIFKPLMKKKLPSWIVACMVIISLSTSSLALAAKTPNGESSQTPEVKRSQRILSPSVDLSPSLITPSIQQTVLTPSLSAPVQQTTATPSLGPNLIINNSLESSSTTNLPTNWSKGGYGTNDRSLTYPVSGYNSSKAVKISISSYTSGDAKWYFDDVPVTPGTTYEFSDYYTSDVQSIIDARYTMNDGSFSYPELVSNINPSSSYKKVSVQFTAPQNVKSMTIFHLINSVGNITTDEYSLSEVTTVQPPTPVSGNLVPNPAFEQSGTNGLPLSWGKGGWGTNTRTFTYPEVGVSGSKAVKVSISSYTSGDAKWYFNPIAVTQGNYVYSDDYISNIPSLITLQYQNSNGTFTYKDIQALPAASNFTHTSVIFSVPTGVQAVSVFHLIQGVGFLTMDNVSLTPEQNQGIFSTGAVTLRFDDGSLSQYQVAYPKLKSAGLKGTFFIISKQLLDYGFSGYMSIAQIKDLYNAGNEIGAHTQDHPYLTQLSSADQQKEILGSRNDLLALNVGPINSFAYPYGDYDNTTLNLVKSDGFSDAAATIDGDVTLTSDKYQLERQSMESTVTLTKAEQWIDNAIAKKEWLILSFHQIDTSGVQYSISPTIFNQVVDYLKLKNVPVVTIQDGIKSLP